jgi:CheY-like chemotaxis protein
MLSNVNTEKDQILQIILVGQPGLRDTLRRPDLVQFAQRIGVDYHLDALDATDTRRYIRHRLQVAGGDADLFEPEACDRIFHYSGGVPRLINLLCDTALVYGYAEQAPTIHAGLVEDVAREKLRGGIFPRPATAPEADSAPGAAPPAPANQEPRRLRVAVLADSESQRAHLQALLEKCGMQVTSTIPFDGRMLDVGRLRDADVLFVDLDENVDRDLHYLERLLEQSEIPVLFNDSSALRAELDGPQTELRKRLTLKLTSLVAR